MIFDLSNELEIENFKTRLNYLLNKGSLVEITEKREKKTYSQLKYIHVVFGVIGLEYGLKTAEAKYLIKENMGVKIKKNYLTFPKSLADYDKEEMSLFIDKIIRKFGEQGLYIPSPEDHLKIQMMEMEIERNRRFLT